MRSPLKFQFRKSLKLPAPGHWLMACTTRMAILSVAIIPSVLVGLAIMYVTGQPPTADVMWFMLGYLVLIAVFGSALRTIVRHHRSALDF